MNIRANKRLRLPLIAGGIATILVSSIALGSLAISAKGLEGMAAPAGSQDAEPLRASSAVRTSRCAECGVIASTRIIAAPDESAASYASGQGATAKRSGTAAMPVRNYEITIRLQNGSMRVITDANSARWRRGEPVTVIAGAQ